MVISMNRKLILLAAPVICSCAGSHTALSPLLPPAGAGAAAEVQSVGLVVAFPSDPRGDTGWTPQEGTRTIAGYFWHVSFRTSKGWLWAALQLDPAAVSELPEHPSLAAVVAAARVSSCELDTHVVTCGDPIKGRAWVVGDHVVIAITDKRWQDALLAEHPDSIEIRRGRDYAYQFGILVPLAYR